MNFVIEKNVPLPPRKHAGSGHSAYRFVFNMEVGDSFLIAGTPDDPAGGKAATKMMASIHRLVRNHNRKHSVTFKVSCRKVSNGYRVWRVQ